MAAPDNCSVDNTRYRCGDLGFPGGLRALPAECIILALIILLMFASSLCAQSEDSDTQRPVPIFSAGMGFITQFAGGQPNLDPLISPIFLVPIGDRWLIESRDTFESDFSTPPGSDTFHGVIQKEVDYLQLDFIANPYMTVTVGRYLTPFGSSMSGCIRSGFGICSRIHRFCRFRRGRASGHGSNVSRRFRD